MTVALLLVVAILGAVLVALLYVAVLLRNVAAALEALEELIRFLLVGTDPD